jgi:choline dehydrogenase-like flavoprotein
MTATLDAEALVVGSGAGGAVTALRLAEAGLDVLLVEEGPWVDPDRHDPFSREEMAAKYRHRGLAATLGRPPISYVEGRCVGGGTEINSGLFHRPPARVIDDWRRRYGVAQTVVDLHDQAAAIERDLCVGSTGISPASALLDRGARTLGWASVEVPRVFRPDGTGRAVKQTMTRTYVPAAVAAGARVVPDCEVRRLTWSGARATGAVATRTGPNGAAEPVDIRADDVFVCSGAIQTPALLRRSGIRRNVGWGLKVHPTIKVAARFPTAVDGREDVSVHQVKEFSPEVTLGGSISRRGYVALSLADSWARNASAMEAWDHVAVYYASIRSDGSGRVMSAPGLRDPLVRYRLQESDLSRLARGAVHLGELLFAAGAVELFPSVAGAPSMSDPTQLAELWPRLTRSTAGVMTIHLFSSVKMGERREVTATNSFGRIWGFENLRVNDASLLPDAPGVNPQGTIMAVAAANCAAFLAER